MPDETPPTPTPAQTGSAYTQGEKITKINVADEIKNSFLDYSMSVIISRALPDVRDGLKPSQRRILYAMHELSLFPGRKHYKCAKICGDTSGNYHPHGEAVIYPTLVHMAQPWVMREKLVDGKGNFGSVEADPPAAMRYTEARLTHLGAALMQDMDRDTVDFVPNYDERMTEPTVFPAAFPNLLVNGGTGIAVGMATNMPPHNLGEIVDGICAQIDDPAITIAGLMKFIKGPDFPTGGFICGIEGIKNYFETGRGSIKLRGKIGSEELRGNREQLVITEIPFNVNRAALESSIADLVNQKIITDISAMRNESDEHCRLVIELKRDALPKVVINNLFQHTQLEISFSVNALAIDHGKPKTLNLKQLISAYIDHRREVILRRTRFELRKAEDRAEILEGHLVALANLDEFIHIIRSSDNKEEARVKLLAFEWTREQVERWGILIRRENQLTDGRYSLAERQVDAILELRLYQLTGLEIDKVEAEYKALLEVIKDLMDILAKEPRVMGIMKAELKAIKEKHATPRLSQIVPDEGEIAIEDLIANEGVIITLTHAGLLKRTAVSAYRAQRRGGKGVIGMTTREADTPEESDFIEHLFTASTHDYLMFFTNSGRVYVERVHEIPDMGRASKGRSIANLLELQANEKIAALIRIQSKTDANKADVTWQQPGELFFATQQGTVKKTTLNEYGNVRKGGIIAIGIDAADKLIDVKLTRGSLVESDEVKDPGDDVVLITHSGMSIRFSEADVRSMGRGAGGVKGITLEAGDEVVALAIVVPDATLLVAGENGIGKRTSFDEYLVQSESGARKQSRGGKGRITMKVGDKTGGVVGALTVQDADEIMLITAGGQMVRIPVQGIREAGRNTMGVKLVNLDPGDKLLAIAPVISEERGEEAPSA
ncbi:MAG: DNA gyrase subunit A [Verrucomicrobia bacterium]|nr:DNA gyrase subunit A [Verrucomicrobiota bacterium]